MKHSEILAGKWDWLADAILKRRVIGFRNSVIKATTADMNICLDSPPEEYCVIDYPTYRPYRYGELPLESVVRLKGSDSTQNLVTGIELAGIMLSGVFVSYERLLKEYERQESILAGETWVPCGVKE